MPVTSSLRLVVPAPAEAQVPDTAFNPTIHHVSQEEALAVCEDLSDKRFNIMGSLEQYSGVHSRYGRCIVLITNSSDAVIIPLA